MNLPCDKIMYNSVNKIFCPQIVWEFVYFSVFYRLPHSNNYVFR